MAQPFRLGDQRLQRPIQTFTNVVTARDSGSTDGGAPRATRRRDAPVAVARQRRAHDIGAGHGARASCSRSTFPAAVRRPEPTPRRRLARSLQDADVGTLVLLPFDRGPIEVLANDVDRHFARTQSGDIVFVQRESDDAPTGTLVHVARDGTRHEIATEVLGFEIPFHGSEREREEILFLVQGPAHGGLWRYVLP